MSILRTRQCTARLVCVVMLLLVKMAAICGCGSSQPPPPAAAPPPPPPPPPPDLSEAEVAKRLEPVFRRLYMDAFDPLILRLEGGALGREIGSPLSPKEQPGTGSWDMSSESVRGYQSEMARERILGIYLKQALDDSRNGRYHRSHVLFRDIAEVRSRRATGGLSKTIAEFFENVPDRKAVADFIDALEAYVEKQVRGIVFIGEHAAVLKAAGFDSVSEFERRELVTQLEEITIPMLRQGEARTESYGFNANQISQLRKRLESLLSPLKSSLTTDSEDRNIIAHARDTAASETYGTIFTSVKNSLGTDDDADTIVGNSFARQMEQLWSSRRPFVANEGDVGGWIQEKELCAESSEDFLIWPKLGLDIGLICPTKWDADDKQILDDSREALRELCTTPNVAVAAEWCRQAEGRDTKKECRAGAFYYLLGWYYLEAEDSARAREAFMHGAKTLLDGLKSVRLDAKRDAAQLIGELNAYRLLIAAAGINSPEPGALTSTSSYLAELRVLLSAWRQRWLLSGFPESAAQDAIRKCDKVISLLQANAGRNHDVDRYFFLDYRFQHGATPDVLVKDALRRRAFQPGSTDYTDQMQQELADVPTSFAEETIDRWRGRVKRKKATVTKTDAE